jgi:tRNA (cytidine/uridine-2'-O-)-methyltransferase
MNIVLLNPEIPTNTGNIGRLCLATGSQLHLIKPFGFEITDKRLKRAGLDYWQHLDVKYYKNFNDFLDKNSNARLLFLTAHAKQSIWKIEFESNDFLIFGKESVGLPETITEKHPDNCYNIPMFSSKIRSLNLANAVAVVVYEGLRQITINNE